MTRCRSWVTAADGDGSRHRRDDSSHESADTAAVALHSQRNNATAIVVSTIQETCLKRWRTSIDIAALEYRLEGKLH
jgi:hypothetical protein